MSDSKTVLVVDDNRLVLAALSDGLSRAGYVVLDADNGDDAILLAREHRPALALLDIRMEGKSGFDVASYLRSVCRTPFLFLSAFADDQTVAKVRALGAIDYLVKPLEIGQIVAAVDAAFARIDSSPTGTTAADGLAAPLHGAAGDAGAGRDRPSERGRNLDRDPAGDASDRGSDAGADAVPLATGVLMHRHSLRRGAALAELQAGAIAAGRTLQAQAERIVAAVEDLARAATPR